ncbi:MerR family transcriptional regulator [Xylanimonas protaetiae]|uniref:MerR family transcriptional regulator n=1 Tax=Xylanimonas protaetiae TaxID=2509457 RepID=A0A4P6F457_9MICO|nr:MerR family transcriptional regulator [Xylanimonas protaetiae]QAY69463.1 MerR family transcriptional regulator [Xylanimonas protaetiae]
MTDRGLTSGEMSRASGLSPKALRLYHANGLLVPATVDDVTGYRTYGPDQVARGRTIALLRRLELPLERVAAVVDAPPDDARDLLMRWWGERRAAAGEGRAAVEAHLAATMPVRDDVRRRTVPARKVATLTSEPDQAALVPTFTADVLTVRAHLAAQGARFGDEYWVVYRELTGPGVTGRVETCVPYEGTVDPAGAVVLREEPAGEEAFLPVTVRECAFPQIVDLHAATVAAARRAGVASPVRREIYAVPWSDDDPDAVVAEAAVRW